jgi:hypothetical protein
MGTLELSYFFHCIQVTAGCGQAYSEVIVRNVLGVIC